MNCNQLTIWNFRQNKPSLVVNDIIKKYPEIDPDFIYTVLLQRGIFKWLSVRRDIIKLKNEMLVEIKNLNHKKTSEEKGYYKAVIKWRKKIRKLCHSARWVAPDFDQKANKFLKSVSEISYQSVKEKGGDRQNNN